MPEMPMEKVRVCIPSLLSIARDAGTAILEVYRSDFAVEHKEDRSPLTHADRRSHEIIVKGLTGLEGMHIPVLSEEGKNIPFEERRGWELFWLVDPLDGTKEFVKRNGEFTVNIAFMSHGRPLAGVIYIPLKDVFYFAAEGLGSFRLDTSDPLSSGLLDVIIKGSVTLPITNDQSPIRRVPSRLTVIGSRSHMSSETEQFINSLRAEHGEVDLISAGSSLKFCLIAEGKADVYPRFAPTMEWDTGAGQAIVEQAGGKVVRADAGGPLIYNKQNLLNPWFIATSCGFSSLGYKALESSVAS